MIDRLSPQARQILDEGPFDKVLFDPGDPTWRDRAHRAWADDVVVPEPHTADTVEIAGVRCLRVTTPGTDDDGPAVVHFHGGAYIMGSPELSLPISVAIAVRCGMPVISIDYRLAPEDPFPAAVDDGLVVYAAVSQERPVALLGESAGGGLAVAVAVAARDSGLVIPASEALLSPFADLTGSSDSVTTMPLWDPWFPDPDADLYAPARAYAGDTPLDHPGVSPVFADLAGLGPMLIQVGSREVLAGDAYALARAARAAGVATVLDVWDGLWHVWHTAPVPEAGQALDEVAAFVVASLQR